MLAYVLPDVVPTSAVAILVSSAVAPACRTQSRPLQVSRTLPKTNLHACFLLMLIHEFLDCDHVLPSPVLHMTTGYTQ